MRAGLQAVGALLENPSVNFGDDSDAVLVENMLTSVAQHHRQKNSEQTHDRIRGRPLNGYWPFRAPTGYNAVLQRGFGKVLVVDPVEGPVIKEALEGFARGRLKSQAEVTRFLNAHPVFEREKGVRFKQHNLKAILTNFVYAGLVGREEWDVSLRKGNHEALISVDDFETIQDRLSAGSYGAVRRDASEDFPMRGFVACGGCGKLLTSCWATSHTCRKYAYYYCHRRACRFPHKNVRKERIDAEFGELLGTMVPKADVMVVAEQMFKDLWNDRQRRASAVQGEMKRRVGVLEQNIERYLDQLVESENKSVIAA